MTATIVVSKALILILLSVGMYFLIKAIREYELLQKVRSKMDELDRQRLLSENPEGILQKYLNRLDEQLVQAGVKKYLPRAGVEIYFLFNVLEFTLIFCLAGDGILIPLLIAGLAVYFNKMILDILRFRNKRITEKHLLELLSLISDYSLSESEITMILYRCGQMMPNPLMVMISIDDLHDFKGYPFKVLEDGAMFELAKSIEEKGVIVPLILRKNPYGAFHSGYSGSVVGRF